MSSDPKVVHLARSRQHAPPRAPTPTQKPRTAAPVVDVRQHDRYQACNPRKVEDSLTLILAGLGMEALHHLTRYPKSYVRGLYDQADVQLKSGRRKTSLAELVRNPLHHAAGGHFVAMLCALGVGRGSHLDERIFVTALRKHYLDMGGTIAEVHPDLLLTLAYSFTDGTTVMTFCRSCRCNYAHIEDATTLASGPAFGCPSCRELGILAGSGGNGGQRSRRKKVVVPTGVSDLNIGKPLTRFAREAPADSFLHATLRALGV